MRLRPPLLSWALLALSAFVPSAARAQPAGAPEALTRYLRALASVDMEAAARLSIATEMPYVLSWKVLRWEKPYTYPGAGEELLRAEADATAAQVAELESTIEEVGPICDERSKGLHSLFNEWEVARHGVDPVAEKALDLEIPLAQKERDAVCDLVANAREALKDSMHIPERLAVVNLSIAKRPSRGDSRIVASAIIDLTVQSVAGVPLTRKHRAMLERWTTKGVAGRWVILGLDAL